MQACRLYRKANLAFRCSGSAAVEVVHMHVERQITIDWRWGLPLQQLQTVHLAQETKSEPTTASFADMISALTDKALYTANDACGPADGDLY